MPQYILRDLPTELWNKVKDRAQRDGWPLRALFLRLLAEYAIGRVQLGSPPTSASPALQSLHRAHVPPDPLPSHDAPSLRALSEAGQTKAVRVAIVRLHDGDRQLRIPDVAYANEEDKYLALYDEQHRPLGRFDWHDLKTWWLEEPA